MECLSCNPAVVQVHNALSDAEATEMSTWTADGGGRSKAEFQVSQKLAAITGLHTTGPSASDPMELHSYLPGGHAETHVDSVIATLSVLN